MARKKNRGTKAKPQRPKQRRVPKKAKAKLRARPPGAKKTREAAAKAAQPRPALKTPAPRSPRDKTRPGVHRGLRRRLAIPQLRPAQGRAVPAKTGANAYETDLDRNAANFQPLTPLTFLEHAAH